MFKSNPKSVGRKLVRYIIVDQNFKKFVLQNVLRAVCKLGKRINHEACTKLHDFSKNREVFAIF